MINLKFEKSRVQDSTLVPLSGWKAVQYADSRNAIQMLRFLLSPKGRKVLQVMSDEFQTVSEIRNLVRLEQSEVSVALQQMRRFDLVLVERVGKYHYYKLDYHRLAHIMDVSSKLAAFYDPDAEDPKEEVPMEETEEIGSLHINGSEI